MNPSSPDESGAEVRPLRVALTGGIAVGKSSVEEILRDMGIAVLDTDSVAHQCLRRGHPAHKEIVREFGEDVVRDDGTLDRQRLGDVVFHDEHLRNRLNQIVHPVVKQEVERWLEEQRMAQEHAVVAVPLLFEANMDRGWDYIVCVDAAADVVAQRLAERGLSADQAQARIKAQLPQPEKRRRSDIVIENNDSLEGLRQRVLDVWREITQKEQDHE